MWLKYKTSKNMGKYFMKKYSSLVQYFDFNSNINSYSSLIDGQELNHLKVNIISKTCNNVLLFGLYI